MYRNNIWSDTDYDNFPPGFMLPVNAQNKDKAVFIIPKPGFYQNSILKDDREVKERLAPPAERKIFIADLSGYQFPSKVDLYTTNSGIIPRYHRVTQIHAGVFQQHHSLNRKHTG